MARLEDSFYLSLTQAPSHVGLSSLEQSDFAPEHHRDRVRVNDSFTTPPHSEPRVYLFLTRVVESVRMDLPPEVILVSLLAALSSEVQITSNIGFGL